MKQANRTGFTLNRCRAKVRLFLALVVCAGMMLAGCGNTSAPEQAIAENYRMTILDTGKSDCILIEMDGMIIVNDTADADDYKLIMDTLENKGIERIDYMIISHFDKDHIGSAPDLLRKVETGCVIMPDFWGDSYLYQDMIAAIQETGTEQMRIDEPYEIKSDKGTVAVYPPLETAYDNENNYSLITSIQYGEADFLLMGDALKQRTGEFAESLSPEQTYDLIKTPHHGDYNKELKNMFENCQVSYAVITAGNDETIEDKLTAVLNQEQVTLYKTYDGDVVVDTDGTNITVTQ